MNRRLRHSCKYVLMGLFLVSFWLLSPPGEMVFAEDKAAIFNKDIAYDVYYEVSEFEVDCLENVRVLGTVLINDISFLVIRGGTAFLEGQEGYILLSSVRTILPRGFIPKRIFDTGTQKRS